MALQLIKLHAHPSELAVTKVGSVVSDGAFFLDFSRPLEHVRWLGVKNRWLGFTVGLLVPVVHQGQDIGAFVISVARSDPCFRDLRTLWRTRYPSKRPALAAEAELLQIIADFATQFPEDGKGP